MEKTLHELAGIISAVESKFPDEQDLKRFPGISKALILNSLSQSSKQLEVLREHDNEFETILLKRELAEVFRDITKTISHEFDTIKPQAFNDFLGDVAEIKFLIRETYLSVVSQDHFRAEADIIQLKTEASALRDDITTLRKVQAELQIEKDNTLSAIQTAVTELNQAKNGAVEKINEASTEVSQLKPTAVKTIAELLESAKENSSSLDAVLLKAQSDLKTVEANAENIESSRTKIETFQEQMRLINNDVTTWTQEIITAKELIEAQGQEYESLNKQATALTNNLDKAKVKILGGKDGNGVEKAGYLGEIVDLKNSVGDFIETQKTRYDTQFKEIEGLLPGATSAGLAQAYQDQKNSYRSPIRNWSVVFVLTLVFMIAFSVYIIILQVQQNSITDLNSLLTSLLKYVPFYLPTIWLVAYASKQQSQSKRLQQEYAFKETNAKSFHGHKVQIEELMKQGSADKELLDKLVETLVFITAQNPSQTLENKAHNDSPPTFKLFEKLLPSFGSKKAKEGESE